MSDEKEVKKGGGGSAGAKCIGKESELDRSRCGCCLQKRQLQWHNPARPCPVQSVSAGQTSGKQQTVAVTTRHTKKGGKDSMDELTSLHFGGSKPFVVFEEFKGADKLFGPRGEIDDLPGTVVLDNLVSPGSSPEDILIAEEVSSFRQQVRDQEEERKERAAWKLRKELSRFQRGVYWGDPSDKLPKQLGFSR